MEYIEQFWRDATPADAIKEPPMVARFKWRDSVQWKIGELTGVDKRAIHTHQQWFSVDFSYPECQVYDPPAGFEIGEGWRLIDNKKDTPQTGDENYEQAGNKWIQRSHVRPYHSELIYRRRIEQLKPKYVLFTWEDREELRGRWIVDGDGDEQCIMDLHVHQEVFYINGAMAGEAVVEWRFLDTGEPVGKKVME